MSGPSYTCSGCGFEHPVTNHRLDALVDEYAAWCAAQGVPHISATDHCVESLTPAQRAWLVDFELRWDEAEGCP